MAGGESILSSGQVPNIVVRFLTFLCMPLLISVGAYAALLIILALLVPSGFVIAFGLFVALFCLFGVYVYDPQNPVIMTNDGKSIPQMILNPKARC